MNKKGWSIIELLTTVGIIGVLSSIAIISYMKYYQKGQFTKIHETARNFSSAVQVCLLGYDHDPTRCASFERLKFTCEHCESTVWFRPASVPPVYGDSFMINLTVGEYRSVVQYRSIATPTVPVRIQRTGTSHKFCAVVIDGGVAHDIVKPTRTCDADSDCGAGEVCFLFLLPQWGGGGTWQVIP